MSETEIPVSDRLGRSMQVVFAAAIVAAAWLAIAGPRPSDFGLPSPATARAGKPPTPPPAVEPLELKPVAAKDAVAINAAVPFSTEPNPAAPPFRFAGSGEDRARSVDCLAAAMIYEAGGSDDEGQRAVAQVVLNRAFSGKYPDTVCGVVYQNKHRHLACQFTFACDNNKDVIREPDMWERAKKIAKAMLDGQLWLPEVDKSTHYHAYWVRPSWVSEMKKMYKTGVHTFYRPRKWGDGNEAPAWGTPAQTAALSAELAQEAKSSAEMGERR